MSEQTPEQEQPRKTFRRWLRNSCLQLLFCVVLYVLSFGPMYWHWYEARYVGGSRYILAFYEPLRYLCYFEPMSDLLDWYVELWIV